MTSFANTAFAAPEDLVGLEKQANEYKSSISNAQNEYLSAVQMSADLEAQIQQVTQEIADLDAQIAQKQEELNIIVRDEYRQPTINSFINIFINAEDFNSILQGLDYFRHLEEDKLNKINDIKALKEQREINVTALEETKADAEEHAKQAKNQEEIFTGLLDELRPSIEQLRASFSSELKNMSKSSQLSASLDYLENVKGITDLQSKIIRSAYSTGYSGSNRCEAWAEAVYRNAGVSIPNKMSAYTAYQTYYISDTKDDIPAGAWVYGSGTSAAYSHVGVYVGNGLVMDNEGSRKGAAVPLEEWLKWQTTVSANNGRSGWFGWGYPPELEEYFVQ